MQPSSNEPQPSTGRLTLRTLFAVIAVMCGFLAITRPSVAASAMVVLATLGALATMLVRTLRGEIVILLMIVVPPFAFYLIGALFGMVL
jgi:hypothetical protein